MLGERRINTRDYQLGGAQGLQDTVAAIKFCIAGLCVVTKLFENLPQLLRLARTQEGA